MRDCSIKALELEESSQDELIQERWGEASWGSQFSVWPAQSFVGEIGDLGSGYSGSGLEASTDVPGPDVRILSQYSEFES